MHLILLGIGLLIGLVLGLTGAGGSVLAVPLLLWFLHLQPVAATGLALGVVASSSLYGAMQRIWRREVLWVPVLLMGAGGIVFAPLGRLFAAQVPDKVLLVGFSLLSLLVAAFMLWSSIREPVQAKAVRAHSMPQSPILLGCRLSADAMFDWRPRCVSGLLVGGMLTGFLSGFFGVGGGFLIVPFLMLLNGIPACQAVASSLVIIAVMAGSGFVMHAWLQSVDWNLLLWLAAGGVAGMLLGGLLARRVAGVQLQRMFALVIIVMAMVTLLR